MKNSGKTMTRIAFYGNRKSIRQFCDGTLYSGQLENQEADDKSLLQKFYIIIKYSDAVTHTA
jgi:hypothetical protein